MRIAFHGTGPWYRVVAAFDAGLAGGQKADVLH
jgi:hypothetical protein